ncbi:zinc-ribbon domain-containing protein [Candidatus Woesearchaeota archaeon]|nr:zinc-ribbon domain-containing protein [Candidatus Woesearchaeota archaeon]
MFSRYRNAHSCQRERTRAERFKTSDCFRCGEGLMAYCQKCGKQIPDNSEYCTICGAKQGKAYVSLSEEPEVKKSKWWMWMIIGTFILIGCVLVVIFLIGGVCKGIDYPLNTAADCKDTCFQEFAEDTQLGTCKWGYKYDSNKKLCRCNCCFYKIPFS